MKAEKKTVAFMFFSVFLQFVYSLGKKQKHKKNRIWAGGGGGGWRGTRAEGQEGQILVADNRELQ